jgi:hypothetical protein
MRAGKKTNKTTRKRYTSPSHAHHPEHRNSLNAGGKHSYNVTKITTRKRSRESSRGLTTGWSRYRNASFVVHKSLLYVRLSLVSTLCSEAMKR